MKCSIITYRYSTDTHPGATEGPDALLDAGFVEILEGLGCEVERPIHVQLTEHEEAEYGAWNRIALANSHLAELVSKSINRKRFPIVLETNCYAAIGVLGGIKAAKTQDASTIGMIWIDAHGDCNTPETTRSGMLSGMPVAIATGMCLHRIRKQSLLEKPIDPKNVLMVGVRANDVLETEQIDRSGIEIVPVSDIKSRPDRLAAAVEQLGSRVSDIYVHLDIDVLDPSELANLRFAEPGGPTRLEMANALMVIMKHPKVTAFGVSDINPRRDVDRQIISAALAVAEGGVRGLLRQKRNWSDMTKSITESE